MSKQILKTIRYKTNVYTMATLCLV